MKQVRVFVSFDLDHDGDLKDRLILESRKPDSRFEVAARSDGADNEKMRRGIAEADEVIVICGQHTEDSPQMSAELRVAQESQKPYFLLWGRRELMCTRPVGSRPEDAMYSWTPSIVHTQIVMTLRNAEPREVLHHYKKPSVAKTA